MTVSTLYEARVFADHGFDDLTWAFPLVPSRLPEARRLAARLTLRLVVDSAAAVDALEAAGEPLHVFLKIDCGFHRAGVDPDCDEAPALARRLAESERLRFDGLLTHSGHAYQPGGPGHRLAVARQERDAMVRCAARLRAAGIEVPVVSVGSTPAMTAVDHLDGVDEARPGNYALYDATQAALGSCGIRECAATVLTTVVSRSGSHSVVDAGALALSKDAGPPGTAAYGRIFADYDAGEIDPQLRLTSLSQEHGILSAPLAIGTRLRIVPNHSCLTVAQFDAFQVARGEEVVDRWRIWRGRD